MPATDAKVLPRLTPDKQPFWDGLREGKFLTTRCLRCGAISFPPRILCPACWSGERQWIALSGRGTIYAFTRNRIVPRAYIAEAPYVTAMVDLDEGPRILTRIEHAAYEDLAIGQPVQVGFMMLTAEVPFFYFEPVGTAR